MPAFALSARVGLSTIVTACAMLAMSAYAQPPGGGGPGGPGGFGQRGAMPGGPGGRGAMPGRGGGAPQGALANLPTTPTAVELPTLSAEVTGPGPMFDSAPSHAPTLDPRHFGYVTEEYFVSGTADGRPYTTRLVLRRPDDGSYSGLVLAESMHSSGAAHAFEFTAAYVMDSGHVAAEILTVAPTRLQQFNAERYADLNVSNGQENEILAQVGALLKSPNSPLDMPPRKMVMSGSSMSSGTLFNYLPAHRVLRTPDMQNIYDGYMPTSNATMSNVEIDVPLIQLPTLHEFENSTPTKQDSDAPGQQYRLYEIAGIGHVDSRDNVRLIPNPCAQPTSQFPSQAYMSIGLHHLFRWVDEGVPAPHAERIWLDLDRVNDGSMTKRDEHGNVQGGIRSPYVDVPFAAYKPVIAAAEPPIANPAQWIQENQGGAATMCRLSAYQEAFSAEQMRELYGSKRNFLREFEARLNELEAAGWSLPLYHDLIMSDARAVEF